MEVTTFSTLCFMFPHLCRNRSGHPDIVEITAITADSCAKLDAVLENESLTNDECWTAVEKCRKEATELLAAQGIAI